MQHNINYTSIVIDNGSGICKIGFGGEDLIGSIVPSCIGVFSYWNACKTQFLALQRFKPSLPLEIVHLILDYFLSNKFPIYPTLTGKDALKQRKEGNLLSFNRPVQNGIVTNWEEMETIWLSGLKEIGISREMLQEYPLLFMDSIHNSNREKLIEILFEKLHCHSFYISNALTFSLCASGDNTGTVLNIGYNTCDVVSILDSFIVPQSIRSSTVSGSRLDEYMVKLLESSGHLSQFNEYEKLEIASDVKEKLGYCSLYYDIESTQCISSLYQLPDGSCINIQNEKFQCCEALFQPSFIGSDSLSIARLVAESVSYAKPQKNGFRKIIIAGGSTMFPGFHQRLELEINLLLPPDQKILIRCPDERDISAWLGGSILASLSPLGDKMWVTKEEYQNRARANFLEGYP